MCEYEKSESWHNLKNLLCKCCCFRVFGIKYIVLNIPFLKCNVLLLIYIELCFIRWVRDVCVLNYFQMFKFWVTHYFHLKIYHNFNAKTFIVFPEIYYSQELGYHSWFENKKNRAPYFKISVRNNTYYLNDISFAAWCQMQTKLCQW